MKNKSKIMYLFQSLVLFLGILSIKCVKVEFPKDHTNRNIHSVACIFAGREKYLSILMPYLLKLQMENKLTEINLWQFTNNKNDIAYLESISNLHKTSESFTEYREITPLVKNNQFDIKIKAKNDAHILINNKYEIVIGGWGNTKSVIRRGIQGTSLCEKIQSGVLNEKNYKNFKIKLSNGNLIVENFMIASVEDREIRSIKIHTGYGSSGFWDYEETQKKNIKLFDTKKRFGISNWAEPYEYYLDYDFDLFLKIDDDIVYIDLNRYDEFINYIVSNPDKNFVFPNMVNHAVSLFYNNKNGLIPNYVIGDLYAGKNSPDEIYNYYTDGNVAKKVHEYFLKNISVFINNNLAPISLDDHKESICMFGINKKNYNRSFNKTNVEKKTIRNYYGHEFKTNFKNFNDEIYVYNLNGNVLYPRFVTVHYQFGPQIKNGLDESFLSEYKKNSLENTKKKVL
ncbi:hypothetical protein H8356DRAFT_1720176 [Neocallimastix lanati (nom. inval.)]|jgi:hypothetical protein|nr:hypothetical protein H8356DRAFT_1720176 [Neocallimastix sp. JGI-2020a]